MAEADTETKVETPAEPKVETKVETKTKPETPATALVDTPDDAGTVTTDWPEDWRQKVAGKDEKTLKRLERMGSVQDMWKSYTALEKKLAQRSTTEPFPDKGTDEEKATWRKSQGLPEKATEYLKDMALDNGLVIGDNDKPVVEEVLGAMHAAHASPKVAREAVNAYYKIQDRYLKEQHNRDKENVAAVRDSFREEFGQDWRRQLEAAKSVLDMAPADIRELIPDARMANGMRIGDHPGAIRWLRELANEVNPGATVVPTAGGSGGKAVADRMADLQKMMRQPDSDYNRGPKSESLQAEYRKLVDAHEKIERKAR